MRKLATNRISMCSRRSSSSMQLKGAGASDPPDRVTSKVTLKPASRMSHAIPNSFLDIP